MRAGSSAPPGPAHGDDAAAEAEGRWAGEGDARVPGVQGVLRASGGGGPGQRRRPWGERPHRNASCDGAGSARPGGRSDLRPTAGSPAHPLGSLVTRQARRREGACSTHTAAAYEPPTALAPSPAGLPALKPGFGFREAPSTPDAPAAPSPGAGRWPPSSAHWGPAPPGQGSACSLQPPAPSPGHNSSQRNLAPTMVLASSMPHRSPSSLAGQAGPHRWFLREQGRGVPGVQPRGRRSRLSPDELLEGGHSTRSMGPRGLQGTSRRAQPCTAGRGGGPGAAPAATGHRRMGKRRHTGVGAPPSLAGKALGRRARK